MYSNAHVQVSGNVDSMPGKGFTQDEVKTAAGIEFNDLYRFSEVGGFNIMCRQSVDLSGK